jgi:regulator of replication initiation timing
MRHSDATARLHYYKAPTESNITKDDLKEENERLQYELDMLKTRLEEEKTGLQDAKKFAKKRYDVIYALNNKGVKPRQKSIDIYKLVYDDETGLWV